MTKNIIFGLGGLIIGAIGGFVAGKVYYKETYEQQARDEITEMREYYEKKEKRLMTPEGVKELKAKLNEQYGVNNVHVAGSREAMERFRVDDPIDPAESEYPEEEDEDLEDEEPDIGDVNREYEKNKHKKPRIISAEEAGELPPGTESRTFFLYTYDNTITDEDDEEIEQPELLLGDCLDKYDFYSNDELVMFVMNYELSTCYEISKIDAAWSGR